MRRSTAMALLVLLGIALGCSSSGPQAAAPEVELQLEQLPDAGFAVEEKGAVSIAYQLSVKNLQDVPITLQKIAMRTVGESPYTLRDVPAEVNQTIEAGESQSVSFTMWGYPREQRSSAKKAVWVSGTAYFDRPTGSFRKEFTLSFREP